ncbi:hypothetical protein RB25_23095 [Herbaspirillum rubrisubalbicans]|uniref:AraC family transcriptional regulator n=1 Tax=Herbaspirillum rubrisubalbicans TaxID=80842 RepID=UPI000DC40445|nr:helix-turn-helix transcriptional regulator [Herbaspirillum rubrisubalbicans]RAN43654.1 hypothetical protein RB25_23095 [Herbaspirillum rubrisubalbicans]
MTITPEHEGNYSESLDGPTLFVLEGEDLPGSEFRLGTRQYDWHEHVRGQLFCVQSGFVQVSTVHGAWLLPPSRAAWIPPAMRHKVSISGAMSGWTVLVHPDACRDLQDRPCVITIGELLGAIIRRALSWSKSGPRNVEQQRISEILLDEVRLAPHEGLHLPMPEDRRLLRIAVAFLKEPDSNRTQEQWARWADMSPSTLSRRFQAETCPSFAQWQQLARLIRGLEMLANRASVSDVSHALGYATPSSFIVMFKRYFGDSPAHYFAERKE